MFRTLAPVSPGEVRVVLANGTVSNDIQGRGTVAVHTVDSRGHPFTLILNNALYMPNLDYIGIISVKLLLDQGMQVIFKNPHPYLKCNKTKVPMQIRNNLYHLNAVRNKRSSRKTAMQWHQIMGHMSFEAILKLPDVTRGMEISHRGVRDCLSCIRGKTKISHNRTPDTRATIPFSFIHSDIHGPTNVPETQNGYRYIANFVDDATNYIAIYIMEKKSDLPTAFEQFLADHAPYGTVTRLRSDCGAEYTSSHFKSIIRKNKIRHELSSPYSPWQNGSAERAWGTLGSNVRCMMHDTAVPKHLWWLAYKHAAYIYNRSYVTRIQCTPFELAMGYKPDLSNMHKFGANVEAYDHRQQEGKLGPKTKQGIYVGHKENTTGFLVYFEDEESTRCVNEVRFPFEWEEDSDGPSDLPDTDLHNNQEIETGSVVTSSPQQQQQQHHLQQAISRSSPGPQVRRPGLRPRPATASNNTGGDDRGNYNVNILSAAGTSMPCTDVHVNYCDNANSGTSMPTVNSILPVMYNEISVQHDNLDIYGNPVVSDQLGTDYLFNIKALEYCYGVNTVPNSYSAAMKSPDADLWLEAMNKEYASLNEYLTFDLVSKPDNVKLITGRWVFSIKVDPEGNKLYKARWVARGFLQTYGLNFKDTFAPMSRMTTIRVLMFLTAVHGFVAHQMDVCTAYLNADVDYKIYMQQPTGYIKDKSKVCLLRKSLYGLKQSAKLWNETIHYFLISCNFVRSSADQCLYIKKENRGIILIILWVDDIVIVTNNNCLLHNFKKEISAKFKCKDLGKLKFFLGVEFQVENNFVSMSQASYCRQIIQRFGMMQSTPRKTPLDSSVWETLRATQNSALLTNPTKYRELVGSLIYLQQVTRPDLSFAVNLLGQNMASPRRIHWEQGLNVLRYLRGTIGFSLQYRKFDIDKVKLIGYADADWANAPDRKSMSGFCFKLASNSSMISWASRKQSTVATSTTESEYIALSEATCEAIWLQKLLRDLNIPGVQFETAKMFCDNTSALALTGNPCHHRRTKHIEAKYHHVRDHIEKQTVDVEYVPSKENWADGFTKSLPNPLHKIFTSLC